MYICKELKLSATHNFVFRLKSVLIFPFNTMIEFNLKAILSGNL